MNPNSLDNEVLALVRRVDLFAQGLPEPLCAMGEEFAERGFPYRKMFVANDLAFPGLHLPFWVASRYHQPRLLDATRQAAQAALFGYLYIRIQDDIYDRKEGNDPSTLLLANEFVEEMYRILRGLFPHDASFWKIFQSVWRDFSVATAWEIKECRHRLHAISDADLNNVGRKLSFAKVPLASVLICAGRRQDMDKCFAIVDRLTTSSQLLNDFASLERDLATRHFTYPLAGALEQGDLGQSQELSSVMFERFLRTGSLESLFDKVIAIDQAILGLLAEFPVPQLQKFLQKRLALVEEQRRRYIRLKLEVLLGINKSKEEVCV